jgi:hypothetical protein
LKIEGEVNLTTYRSSSSFAEKFCKTCGCHLFAYEDSQPDLMYFAPATIDGGLHPGHPPNKESHIYVGSKAEWEQLADGLPKYDTSSPDEIITTVQRTER